VKPHKFDVFAAALILLTIIMANACLWWAVIK
jgi:hypothetical protein